MQVAHTASGMSAAEASARDTTPLTSSKDSSPSTRGSIDRAAPLFVRIACKAMWRQSSLTALHH